MLGSRQRAPATGAMTAAGSMVGGSSAGAAAAAGTAPTSHQPPPPRVHHDCLFGALAFAMWGAWALKLAPQVSTAANVQSAAGLLAIALVSLAWPTLHAASYRRHRTPALACLRLFLLSLPFNFERDVLDVALPQQLESGRLAGLVNLSHLVSASHLDFLLFTSVGWSLPLRPHMVLQGLMVLVLASFGVHPHCSGKLLSSPEVCSLVQGAHQVLGLLASVLLPGPPMMVVVPHDSFSQTVALMLLAWLVLGWLLPTLLLLRPVAAAAGRPGAGAVEPPPSDDIQGGSCRRGVLAAAAAAADRAAQAAEVGLCSLLPGQPQLEVWRRGPPSPMEISPLALPGPLNLAVRWLLLLVPLWLGCCLVAPLYAPAAA